MMTAMSVFAIVVGLVATVIGVRFLIPAVRFAIAATASATGTVVGDDREEGSESVGYYPRLVFTAGGREWECLRQLGANTPRPAVGTQVRVYFRPDDPASAQVSRFGDVCGAVVVLVFGVSLA